MVHYELIPEGTLFILIEIIEMFVSNVEEIKTKTEIVICKTSYCMIGCLPTLLESLLEKHVCQTKEELALTLVVIQQTISHS